MSTPLDTLNACAAKYAEKHDTDFVVYFGDMVKPRDEILIDACRQRRRRKNILLMLTTRGGDASVAYRIGRAFQKFYKIEERTTEGDGPEFSVFIPTLCKSAGTILATAATRIIMSDFAELGPIEVQLRNPLEAGERISSLAPVQALESLQRHSKTLFRQHFEQLRFDQNLALSTKMASDVATGLTVGLLNPMYEQVDPIRLAEVERSLKISSDYTERLTASPTASNLKDGAVQKLLGGYPNHGFVIDTKEAKEELFKRVDDLDADLMELVTHDCRWLVNLFLDPGRDPYTYFVSSEPEENGDGKPARQSAPGKRKGKPKVRKDDDAKNNGAEEAPAAAAASAESATSR